MKVVEEELEVLELALDRVAESFQSLEVHFDLSDLRGGGVEAAL